MLSIIASSGNELKIFRLLTVRLQYLTQNGVLACQHEEFEPIGDGIYSMHLAGKGFNIRILYSFMLNKEPVLLLCFYERAGKRKTNYTPYISAARERLISEKEAFNRGK